MPGSVIAPFYLNALGQSIPAQGVFSVGPDGQSDPRGNDTDPVFSRPASQLSVTATILSGANLSGAVDCGSGRRALRLHMSAAWTAAAITIQTSVDGATFADAYDNLGVEYTIQAAAGRSILLPLSDFIGIRYFKLRSGTSGTPVNQGADRALTLITQGL